MTRNTVCVVWVVLLLTGSRGVRGVPLRGHSGVIFGTEFLRILDDHVGGRSYDGGLEDFTQDSTRDQIDSLNDGVRRSDSEGLKLSPKVSESEVAPSMSGGEPLEDSATPSTGDSLSSRHSRRLESGSSAPSSSSSSPLPAASYSSSAAANRLGRRQDKLASSSDNAETDKSFSSSSSIPVLSEDDYDYFLYYYDLDDFYRDNDTALLEGSNQPTSTTESPASSTTHTTTGSHPPSTTTTTTRKEEQGHSPTRAPRVPGEPRIFRYTTPGPKSRVAGRGGARRANRVGDARGGGSSSSSVVVEVRVESPSSLVPSSTTTTTTPTPPRPVEASEGGRSSHQLTDPLVVEVRGSPSTTAFSAGARPSPPHTTTTTNATPDATTLPPEDGGEGVEVVGQSVVASVSRSDALGGGGGGGAAEEGSQDAPPRHTLGSPPTQQGVAPKGTAPFGSAPGGLTPFGSAPEGVAPLGIIPKGIYPQGLAPVGGAGVPGLRLVDASVGGGGAAHANSTVGYVVEEHNVSRFRLEEKTPDGFIIGEYGVVDHQTGDVNGVRYTADGAADPALIYDALMKFLRL